MLDLDRFKEVNDVHGHAGGDAVLQALATRLRGALRAQDVVARFGGEEVVVFLPGLTPRAAMDVAERLRRVVRDQPCPLPDGGQVTVTVSVGDAWTAMTGTPGWIRMEALVRQADAALYAAKRAGRDCWRLAAGTRTGEPPPAWPATAAASDSGCDAVRLALSGGC